MENSKDLEDRIIQSIPKGLTKLEIARYVYIELGKIKRFSPAFYYGNTKVKRKIVEFSQKCKKQQINKHRTLICISLARIYANILRRLGIDCAIKTIREREDIHAWVEIFYNKDDKTKVIRADLMEDLNFIQAGRQTTAFGVNNEDTFYCEDIDKDELRRIDKKIGYIEEDYRDKDIDEMLEKMEGKSPEETLQTILEDERIYGDTHFQGHMERRTYYANVIKLLSKAYYRKKIFLLTCYHKRDEYDKLDINKKNYGLCAFSHKNGQIISTYVYSVPLGRFVNVTMDQLSQLRKDGLIIGSKSNVPGVSIINKALDRHDRSHNRGR